MKYIGILFLVILCMTKLFRCIITNLHNIGIYSVLDIVRYFKNREYKKFPCYGIDMYVGMFGHGKTLSMVHRATQLYKQYGDSLIFYSNFKLNNIPYIPLINFNQLVELGEEMPDGIEGYVVLIDEISTVLSHRNYANFPLEMLSLLCQQRKRKCYIMATCQRYFMCDKIFRSITTNVIDCNKFWRFAHNKIYDAWDYENAMNTILVKRLSHSWWFVKDKDYNAYDTSEMISKTSASDFISNEEAIVRKGLDATTNAEAIRNPSKYLRKKRKSA